MASVYSTRFLEAQGLTTTVSYTVPGGYLVVVRCVSIWLGVQPLGAQLTVRGPAGQVFAELNSGDLESAFTVLDMRHVFTEGETFTASADVGNGDVTVSGYLLTLP